MTAATCAGCGRTIYLHDHDGAHEWCSDRTPTNICHGGEPHVPDEV